MTTQDIINQALSFHKRGDVEQAASLYRTVLDEDPKTLVALHMLGVIDRNAGRMKDAIKLLSAAHELAPDHAEICFDLGMALAQTGQQKVAVEAMSLAVSLNPEQGPGWHHLGRLYRKQCEPEKAAECFRKAVELTKNHPASVIELAKVEAVLGNFDNAKSHIERLVKVEGSNAKYLAVYAQILWVSGDLIGAMDAITRAIEIDDNTRQFYFIFLSMLEENGDDEKILALYRDMNQRWPDDHLTQRNQAEYYFSRGMFKDAWRLYRQSHDRLGPNGRKLQTEVANWAGEPIQGKRLALTMDQGLGEQLLFLRFVPEIAARSQVAAVELDPRLVPLARRSYPDVNFVPWVKPTHPDILDSTLDFYGVLGDFGQILRTNERDFVGLPPAINADPKKVSVWREKARAAANGDVVVGLSYASEKSPMAMEKSIPLTQLNGLKDVGGVKFLNLQYGESRQHMNDWALDIGLTLLDFPETDPIKDVDEHAALILATDLVISVSTATAHFSAALGHPTWVLLPYAQPHYLYWSGAEDSSIWYPSVTTLTPKPGEGWSFVGERLAQTIPTLRSA